MTPSALSNSLWSLAQGVHAVPADSDVVFLDVAADAYSCLPGGANEIAFHPGGRVEIGDAPLATDLHDAGLIVPQALAPVVLRRPAPSRAVHSAVRTANEPPSPGDVWQALACSGDVFFNYRGRAFADLIEGAKRGRVRTGRPGADLVEVVDRFHRWVPYAPVSGKCLLRAFMLLRLLRRQGHEAQWVFGVTTWPFRAHCWLQAGEMVLDDSLEFVAPFHPIMVV
jgi:transglutaminase superfamily protein